LVVSEEALVRRLAWLTLLIVGCKTQANGRYCDESTVCPTTFPFCDLTKNECTALPPPADAAVILDLSAVVVDLSVEDLPVQVDAAIDAAMPDLALPVACNGFGDCPSPSPICQTGMCRACSGAADDAECVARSAATPHCRLSGPSAGQCVQCNSGGDCPSPSPACNASGACVKCQQHSDCASSICILDGAQAGTCADPFDIAWVDNGGQTIANCKMTGIHDGAPAHPYCDINDALTSGRPFIRVIGHMGAPYTPMSLTIATSGSLTIVGPGVGVLQPATIFDGTTTGFGITVNSGAVNLRIVLDGIELGDRTVTSNQSGMFCNNGGSGVVSMALRRGAVRNQNSSGVSATNCVIEISNSTITKNNNVGVSLAGSTATLTGNTISANTGNGVNSNNNGGTLGTLTLNSNSITSNTGTGVNYANTNLTASGNTISSNATGVGCQGSSGGSSSWIGNTISANTNGGIYSACNILNTVSNNTISGNTTIAGVTITTGTTTLTGNVIASNPYCGVNIANSTVVLNSNSIGPGNNYGVYCSASTCTLDANVIFGNAGANGDGVVVINTSSFTMTNNFIFTNAGDGVYISTGSTGKFLFNTVVANGVAGVDCDSPAAMKPIEASIVWGNNKTGGTQFAHTSCELLDTVTGTDSYAGARQLDPAFVNPSPSPSPYDYHLKKGASANVTCCFDKVGGPLDGGSSPLPTHDIDGDPRPLGSGYDVGADEAQ
jgi:hypothetical protein